MALLQWEERRAKKKSDLKQTSILNSDWIFAERITENKGIVVMSHPLERLLPH